MTRDELQALIMQRAAGDSDFAAKLEADPKATLQSVLDELKPGFALPEGLSVTLLKETPEQLYLTMPIMPQPSEGLEASAAGPATDAAVVVNVSTEVNVATLISSAVCIDVVQVVGSAVVVSAAGVDG